MYTERDIDPDLPVAPNCFPVVSALVPLAFAIWFHKMPAWVSLNGGKNWIGYVVGVILQMWYFSSLENYQGKKDDSAGKFNYFDRMSNSKFRVSDEVLIYFLRCLNRLLSLGNLGLEERIKADLEFLFLFLLFLFTVVL